MAARASNSLVTLFGGGGFLGRYVVQALLKTGARVRIAERDPSNAFSLRPLAALGQLQFVSADIRSERQVAAAVEGSGVVVNLVGILAGAFQAIHVDGAAAIARAAAAEGAGALVHMSAIGADPAAESDYGRSKGEGEAAVRAAFPGATILRPSVVFGREDMFVNKFAQLMRFLPVVPVLKPGTRLQPVWVADVGEATAAAALEPRVHGGRTYELGGPQVFTMRELNEWIGETTGRRRTLVDVPDAAGAALARLGFLPGAPITWDQWLMLGRDSVAAPGTPGLDAFGIRPSPLAAVAENWLTLYRRRGRFATQSPY